MDIRLTHARIDKSAGPFRRAIDYAFYDWTREMSRSKRIMDWMGITIQGYAVYAAISRSLVWPILWPKGLVIYPIASLIYLLGNCMLNATLTSGFVPKTQLESDQIAARQIQQTLIPQTVHEIHGYYESRTAKINCGCCLLVFTDGLEDSIAGPNPGQRLLETFAEDPRNAIANLRSLVDAKLKEDDITILLLHRNDSLDSPLL